jgi:hypothetical protein
MHRKENSQASVTIPRMSENQPEDTLKLGLGEVTLYRGGADVNGSSGDRMTVQHFTGEIENVVIFAYAGTRRVTRIQQELRFSTSSPAVPVSMTDGATLVDIPDDDQKRLLAIYDNFKNRTHNP